MTLTRIVPIADLPDSLWSSGILRLPPSLTKAYADTIAHHELDALASTRDLKNPPVGGLTEADAEKHFAQAFDGSCARSALALLDPKGEVQRVADGLALLFAGGRVALLDAPCGAGAFFISVLSALADLRAAGTVPRHPLDVVIVGGDVNQHAQAYAHHLLDRLKDTLAHQAIFVEFDSVKWDVLCDVSTAILLKDFIIKANSCDRTAVVISNFSGFLKSSKNWDKAEPQLKSMFLFCAGAASSAIWIEPQTNAATISLRDKVISAVRQRWSSFMAIFGSVPDGQEQEKAEVPFALPLTPDTSCKARLAVMRFDLRSPKP